MHNTVIALLQPRLGAACPSCPCFCCCSCCSTHHSLAGKPGAASVFAAPAGGDPFAAGHHLFSLMDGALVLLAVGHARPAGWSGTALSKSKTFSLGGCCVQVIREGAHAIQRRRQPIIMVRACRQPARHSRSNPSPEDDCPPLPRLHPQPRGALLLGAHAVHDCGGAGGRRGLVAPAGGAALQGAVQGEAGGSGEAGGAACLHIAASSSMGWPRQAEAKAKAGAEGEGATGGISVTVHGARGGTNGHHQEGT